MVKPYLTISSNNFSVSKTLIIRHTIPISENGPCVILNQWIPKGEKEALTRTRSNLTARLWLDRECILSLQEIGDEDLSTWENIKVGKVYVDVIVRDVSVDLASFIYDEREAPKQVHHGITPDHPDYTRFATSYESLGLEVYDFAVTILNRFISYARNQKGQYWLQAQIPDPKRLASMNNYFNAKVHLDDRNWFRWCPPAMDHLVLQMAAKETYITTDDWSKAQDFVESDTRADLVRELLANSELLLHQGRRRSAVIEASCALEVALSRFGKRPKLEEFVTPELICRFDVNQLYSQIEHMGATGSFRYLLPILFPEKVLSTQTLKQCQELIVLRHSVVHAGQRDVEAKEANQLVKAARQGCETLIRYTEDSTGSPD